MYIAAHYVNVSVNEEECNSFEEIYQGRKILKKLPNGEDIFFHVQGD